MSKSLICITMHMETITDFCYSYSIQREGGRQFKEVASTPGVKERGLRTGNGWFQILDNWL